MLYVGHFSFEGPEPEFKAEGRERGWFTCIVEAESMDSAADKLRELVTASKGWFTSFEDVERVYLDDLIEVEKVPIQGVLAHLEHTYDDPHSSISTSTPGVPEEFCRSYGWGAETNDNDEEGATMEPFVSFGDEEPS
jgi:hypothetical protein